MRIQKFLDDNFFKTPYSQDEKEDFRVFTHRILNQFLEKIEGLKIKKFDDIRFPINSILNRQRHLTHFLKKSINSYYDGNPYQAFDDLKTGLENPMRDIGNHINVRKLDAGYDFFRIRINKENYPLSSEEFFHIPFNLRGRVKTQRFSIPGFPSLYLGNTVYVCWEELNRPNLDEFQAVRLKLVKPIHLIDLSPPSFLSIEPEKLYNYLMIWPLIYTCSVKVRNTLDTFKPEYIIPQLLLQWVRQDKQIDGILYQTTHIDFQNTRSKGDFLNIVLPVRENRVQGICNQLKSKFEITEAISIQLNQCSTGSPTITKIDNKKLNEKILTLEIVKGQSHGYSSSVLGDLESELLTMKTREIMY